MPATQENRPISVTSPLGQDVLLFDSMRGFDKLGGCSEYTVNLLSTEKDIDFAKVLGKPMKIELNLEEGDTREFNGIVTRFSSCGVAGEYNRYIATVKSWLWLLSRSSDCRIFQDMTVVEIVTAICNKPVYGGLGDMDSGKLEKAYAKLDYCVQYRESDFNFVCRLLDHAGIYFYFKHGKGKHTMVLADSHGAHAPVPGYEEIRFAAEGQRDAYGDERITKWATSGEIQASGFELDDFDFGKMMGGTFGRLNAKESIPALHGQPAYQQYDYPGGYATAAIGKGIADARIEGLHGQCEEIAATSNARGLAAGALFALWDHPVKSLNRDYLVTHAHYELSSGDYGVGGGGDGAPVFEANFGAVGKKHPFRMERSHPKPVIPGPQTAVVAGKAGEEVWTDKYGRVKVQFHWDRLGKRDEKSSCWLRVSQAWAGERWGGMFIPRIGMEVVVEFIDGDPDRPIITGCTYNSANMPPYDLPANQTRSGIKTNSSKGGGGFNEIRFEDSKDAEEVWVQAQRDFNRVVKHNDTLKVGFLAKEPGSQTVEIKLDQKLEVGNDQTVHIAKDQKTRIDATQDVKIGQTLVIEAGTSIELKVGGSSIKIEAAKITIKSTQIAIEGDATVDVKGAMVNIKGTPVKIN